MIASECSEGSVTLEDENSVTGGNVLELIFASVSIILVASVSLDFDLNYQILACGFQKFNNKGNGSV
jgi:hypothetical protein